MEYVGSETNEPGLPGCANGPGRVIGMYIVICNYNFHPMRIARSIVDIEYLVCTYCAIHWRANITRSKLQSGTRDREQLKTSDSSSPRLGINELGADVKRKTLRSGGRVLTLERPGMDIGNIDTHWSMVVPTVATCRNFRAFLS